MEALGDEGQKKQAKGQNKVGGELGREILVLILNTQKAVSSIDTDC